MKTVTIRMYSPKPGVKFGPTVFENMIGKTIPFEIEEGVKVPAILKDYRIVDAGMAVDLDLELTK